MRRALFAFLCALFAGACAAADIGKLEVKGAKRVFIIGHSLGAAFAFEYATAKVP